MKKQYRSNFDPLVDAYLEVYNRDTTIVNETPLQKSLGGTGLKTSINAGLKAGSNHAIKTGSSGVGSTMNKPTPNVGPNTGRAAMKGATTGATTGSSGVGSTMNKPTTKINMNFDDMKVKTHPLSDENTVDIESPSSGSGIRG